MGFAFGYPAVVVLLNERASDGAIKAIFFAKNGKNTETRNEVWGILVIFER